MALSALSIGNKKRRTTQRARKSSGCIGKRRAVRRSFTNRARHVLNTNNMPILSTIMGWKYGFTRRLRLMSYFVNTKQFLNVKWGTANPIMLTRPRIWPYPQCALLALMFQGERRPAKVHYQRGRNKRQFHHRRHYPTTAQLRHHQVYRPFGREQDSRFRPCRQPE